MRKYESVVVFCNSLGDQQIKEEVGKVEGFLSAQGAQELVFESWGKKEVAYSPLGKKRFGDYCCFTYQSDNSEIVERLAGQLRITEGIIKFQTHRISDRVRKFKGNPRRANQDDDDQGDDLIDEADDLVDQDD